MARKLTSTPNPFSTLLAGLRLNDLDTLYVVEHSNESVPEKGKFGLIELYTIGGRDSFQAFGSAQPLETPLKLIQVKRSSRRQPIGHEKSRTLLIKRNTHQ